MIYNPDGLMRYNNGNFATVDDMPLLSQWIKKGAVKKQPKKEEATNLQKSRNVASFVV